MAKAKKYTIGCDYGTLSMRAVVVDVDGGDIIAEHTFEYPHGVISERLPDSDVTLSVENSFEDKAGLKEYSLGLSNEFLPYESVLGFKYPLSI